MTNSDRDRNEVILKKLRTLHRSGTKFGTVKFQKAREKILLRYGMNLKKLHLSLKHYIRENYRGTASAITLEVSPNGYSPTTILNMIQWKKSSVVKTVFNVN